MKRLPKAFQMGPNTIRVVILSKEDLDAEAAKTGQPSVVGLCDYDADIIYLRKAGRGFPKRKQMHTFWHEYFHMLLYHVGRERLARDEVLVDNMGALHLQVMQTAEF
jgi:hypothetical protein